MYRLVCQFDALLIAGQFELLPESLFPSLIGLEVTASDSDQP